jgi:hypothetical protein
VAVGTVTTGAGGSAATVTNAGTSGAAVLNFTIPQGESYACTSATSFAIGTGSMAFTTQTGLAWLPGARARASSLASGANYMEGIVTAYSGTTLTVNISKVAGSGTHADWQISLAGDPGSGDLLSTNNLSDLSNAATARSNLGLTTPTWTGLNTFQGGVQINGNAVSNTFIGSGTAANIWLNQNSAASNATVPEIGAQFTLSSNVGIANTTTAYKIGFTSSVIGGASSASIYGGNIITQGHAGAGGYLVTGLESDINNLGAAATTLGATTAAYGYVTVAAGSFTSTAGYWATGSGASWQYGFAVSNCSGLAAFYDHSSSTNILLADGTHTEGINLFSAAITGGLGGAFISPNNVGFGSANAAGSATIPLIYLDASNASNYGSTAVTAHKFAGNPGGGAAVALITNSHATAGDIVLQLGGGAATAVDTTTLYLNMVNPANSIQRGSVMASDSAGVGHVSYVTASDERLKTSLGPLPDALDRLAKIEVHRYQGRDYVGDEYDVGFFAQNLHKAFPWAVTP